MAMTKEEIEAIWLGFRNKFKADYVIPNDIDELNDFTIECMWRGWLAAKQDEQNKLTEESK